MTMQEIKMLAKTFFRSKPQQNAEKFAKSSSPANPIEALGQRISAAAVSAANNDDMAEVLSPEFLAKIGKLETEIANFVTATEALPQLPEQQLTTLSAFSSQLQYVNNRLYLASQRLSSTDELVKQTLVVKQLQQIIKTLTHTAQTDIATDLTYLLTPDNCLVQQTQDFNPYFWYLARSQELQQHFQQNLEVEKATQLQQTKETLLANICQACEKILSDEKYFLNEIELTLQPMLFALNIDMHAIKQLNDHGNQLTEHLYVLSSLAKNIKNVHSLTQETQARVVLNSDGAGQLVVKIEKLIKTIQEKKLHRAPDPLQRLASYQKDQLDFKSKGQLKASKSVFGLFTQHMHAR